MKEYRKNFGITVEQFRQILNTLTLAERRPADNAECLGEMLENADLTITAWDGGKVVGIARSVTDFHYCCYLSDLAVDREYQRQGIGKGLIHETLSDLRPGCKLILVAAPAANEYYRHLGFINNDRCWIMTR